MRTVCRENVVNVTFEYFVHFASQFFTEKFQVKVRYMFLNADYIEYSA